MSARQPDPRAEDVAVEPVEWADGEILILTTEFEGEWVQANDGSGFVDLEDWI